MTEKELIALLTPLSRRAAGLHAAIDDLIIQLREGLDKPE